MQAVEVAAAAGVVATALPTVSAQPTRGTRQATHGMWWRQTHTDLKTYENVLSYEDQVR